MSEKNRRAEYDRLKEAGKEIPKVLMDEFGKQEEEQESEQMKEPSLAKKIKDKVTGKK